MENSDQEKSALQRTKFSSSRSETFLKNTGDSYGTRPNRITSHGISYSIVQRIQLNLASHLLVFAGGLASALLLTIILCVCKWGINRRAARQYRQEQSNSYSYLPIPSSSGPEYHTLAPQTASVPRMGFSNQGTPPYQYQPTRNFHNVGHRIVSTPQWQGTSQEIIPYRYLARPPMFNRLTQDHYTQRLGTI